MNESHLHTKEIACQQVLREDSSVFSSQWMTIPARHAGAVTPESLLERYLVHVRHFTFSLVRPVRSAQGIEFRLIATRSSLLSFSAPFPTENRDTGSVALRIIGGFLLQPGECGRGELSFIAERLGERMRVVVRLTGYRPFLLGSGRPSRWRKLVYRLTQAILHRIVTVRFLIRLYRELEGGGGHIRVVRVRGVGGEEI